VKRFSEPSSEKCAELLVAIECIPNTRLSQDIKNYLEPFTRWKGRIKWKTREDFLEEIILLLAPSNLSSNPTEEHHAEERQRLLNTLTTRHRIVFLSWPRDPRSRHIYNPLSESCTTMGKAAIKGLHLWGASLFDFYGVQTIDGRETVSTSSTLLGFLKSIGEDYAKSRQMVKRAEREEDPRIIEPFDVAQLIKWEEREITAYMHVGQKKKLEEKEKEGEMMGKGVGDEEDEEKVEKKDSVVWEKWEEEERKEQHPVSQDVTQGDDEGEPTEYSGPVSVPTRHSTSLT